ncbi:translation initiation factor IF-2-like [Aquila chrysaetos chrysaetos]|uniref:translation initiation factor IF-2-like n=1 Tax=Aquila chrysaetos chrysaetos TaxID=223781 RepID=UPI0011771DCB|nr:translation initiation factor IF-2-like [Aquila chrysaetos chrysaetos]
MEEGGMLPRSETLTVRGAPGERKKCSPGCGEAVPGSARPAVPVARRARKPREGRPVLGGAGRRRSPGGRGEAAAARRGGQPGRARRLPRPSRNSPAAIGEPGRGRGGQGRAPDPAAAAAASPPTPPAVLSRPCRLPRGRRSLPAGGIPVRRIADRRPGLRRPPFHPGATWAPGGRPWASAGQAAGASDPRSHAEPCRHGSSESESEACPWRACGMRCPSRPVCPSEWVRFGEKFFTSALKAVVRPVSHRRFAGSPFRERMEWTQVELTSKSYFC